MIPEQGERAGRGWAEATLKIRKGGDRESGIIVEEIPGSIAQAEAILNAEQRGDMDGAAGHEGRPVSCGLDRWS